MEERRKPNGKTGKAEMVKGEQKTYWEVKPTEEPMFFLQIRQTFRVHSLQGTWPKSKGDVQNPTTRQTE